MEQVPTKLLRIYTDESAYVGDRRLIEHVAMLAQDQHLAGVTVLEAMLGFGHSAHMHRRQMFENKRSVVIEIVDGDDKLRSFAASLSDIPDIGLITIEAVEVIGGGAQGAHARD